MRKQAASQKFQRVRLNLSALEKREWPRKGRSISRKKAQKAQKKENKRSDFLYASFAPFAYRHSSSAACVAPKPKTKSGVAAKRCKGKPPSCPSPALAGEGTRASEHYPNLK